MATPTIPNGEEYFFPIIYEGNGAGQRVGKFVPFTDNGTIDNSCLFNGTTNNFLSRTASSNGSGTTLTFSCWVKRGLLGLRDIVYNGNITSNSEHLHFDANNKLNYYEAGGGARKWNYVTTRTFEDTSKWYHIYVRRDTTDSTAADRIQIYVDGERITEYDTETQPALNATGYWNQTTYGFYIGTTGNASYIRGIGYLAEVNMVDGTTVDVSTFGVTDTSTGRWIPKTLSGITYGTNGFRLKFQDSSALGDDTSGNGNDLSATNLDSTNQTTDSPTQNHATFSPNRTANSPTLSEGNLSITAPSSNYGKASIEKIFNSNISSGLYWEYTDGSTNGFEGGIIKSSKGKPQTSEGETDGVILQRRGSGGGNTYWIKKNDSDYADTSVSHSSGDKIGIAVKDNKIWFAVNNTWVLSGDPANGTNPASTLDNTSYMAMLGCYGSTTVSANFGQRSFDYTPPTGFLALQQDNLPSTDRGVSGLVWMKNRDTTDAPQWYDSSRGKHLYFVTNSTAAQATATDGLQKFLAGGQQIEDSDAINTAGESFVSWNWVGNGATKVTNNEGSNTTTVQANTAAGFSIVEFTPPSSGFDAITYGHGLTQAPEWFLWKRTDSTSMRFLCYHHRSYANSNGGYALEFSASNANSAFNTEFGSTSVFTSAPTATTFALRNNSVTAGGQKHMAYCWHGVEGFSKFGQYNANNSTDGPFVYLGFKPKFLIIKSSAAISWYVIDATRSPINPATAGITVDNSQVEFTNQFTIDFLSNGFKIRNSNSGYGASTNSTSHDPYYYMAFAEHPFVGDGTSPVTAR